MKTILKYWGTAVICTVVLGRVCHAQTFTPQFQMPFYFEDAVGNKDTVWIGYDDRLISSPLAGLYNPSFDGPLITNPFDSIFEVRVLHRDNSGQVNSFSFKSIVGSYEYYPNYTCGVSEYACIVVNCKYPPVTMHYDSTLFASNTCENNAIISDSWLLYSEQFWWDAPLQCLANPSGLELDLGLSDVFRYWVPGANIEGGNTDTLPGFFLGFNGYGPCNNFTIGTKESPTAGPGYLLIQPNPTHGDIKVALPPGISGKLEWQLVNALGHPVGSGQVTGPKSEEYHVIDTEGLPKGPYFLILKNETASWVGKVMIE